VALICGLKRRLQSIVLRLVQSEERVFLKGFGVVVDGMKGGCGGHLERVREFGDGETGSVREKHSH